MGDKAKRIGSSSVFFSSFDKDELVEICRECWKERQENSKFANFKSNASKGSFANHYTRARLYDGGQIFALTSQTSAGKFCDLAEQYLQPP